MAKGTGKKCGNSHIARTATCNQGRGARTAVGLTAGAVVVGALSSKKVRAQMGSAIQKGITNTVHAATASKPSMKFNKQSFKRSLRKQNPLIGAHLRTHAMRRKHEPGYRNSKKSFWADGFEGELQAGLFHTDACWKGYVQKGVKRKGNRTVPNCVPAGKAKAEVKRKTGQDGEDKLTSAKRKVWAEGFTPKKTKARR